MNNMNNFNILNVVKSAEEVHSHLYPEIYWIKI